MFCEKCGNENLDNCAYCTVCGAKLEPDAKNSTHGLNDYISIKMKKKTLIIVAACLIAALLTVICVCAVINSSSEQGIVGTWVNESGKVIYEFYEDGTCNAYEGKYYEASESGRLSFYDSYHYLNQSYQYLVSGNRLYISSGTIDVDSSDYYIRK